MANYKEILEKYHDFRTEISDEVASAISDYDNALLKRNLKKKMFEEAEKELSEEKSKLVKLIKPVNHSLEKRGLPKILLRNIDSFTKAYIHFYFENRTR